jgi:hypothetical protein
LVLLLLLVVVVLPLPLPSPNPRDGLVVVVVVVVGGWWGCCLTNRILGVALCVALRCVDVLGTDVRGLLNTVPGEDLFNVHVYQQEQSRALYLPSPSRQRRPPPLQCCQVVAGESARSSLLSRRGGGPSVVLGGRKAQLSKEHNRSMYLAIFVQDLSGTRARYHTTLPQ